MLSYYAPLIVYIILFPVLLVTLRNVKIGILYFFTFVPILVVMKVVATFPQGNNFADFLLISMTLGWFWDCRRNNRPFFVQSPINVAVMLVVVWSVVNLIRGNMLGGFSTEVNSVRLVTWKNYMILPVVYFISLNNIREEQFARKIICCICLTMLAMDFNFYSTFRWMKSEHYSHGIRIAGPFVFLGPNELGLFYSYITFLLLGTAYYLKGKTRNFVLFVCALNFYPILFSYSRAAYVCTLVGILVLGFLKDRRLLVLLVIIVIFYRVILPNSVIERIDMTFLDEMTVQEETNAVEFGGISVDTVGRTELWELALGYFKKYPVLGTGFDTFRHKEGMITHSMYLKILAEQGLIGLAVFIIFIITVLLYSLRLYRSGTTGLAKGIGLGFFTCTSTNLVGSLAGDQSLYYNMMAIYWLFIGIVASFNIHYVGNDGLSHEDVP